MIEGALLRSEESQKSKYLWQEHTGKRNKTREKTSCCDTEGETVEEWYFVSVHWHLWTLQQQNRSFLQQLARLGLFVLQFHETYLLIITIIVKGNQIGWVVHTHVFLHSAPMLKCVDWCVWPQGTKGHKTKRQKACWPARCCQAAAET